VLYTDGLTEGSTARASALASAFPQPSRGRQAAGWVDYSDAAAAREFTGPRQADDITMVVVATVSASPAPEHEKAMNKAFSIGQLEACRGRVSSRMPCPRQRRRQIASHWNWR
jgi:hypothetical protein